MTHIASEQLYSFAPSQVFQKGTLTDIRARLGLENTIPDMERFTAILDHKLTIHINLATSTDGYKFIRLTKDGEYHGDNEFGPDGPKYSVLLQNLGGSIRFIVGTHIDGKYAGSDETFLKYQMKNEVLDFDLHFKLLPVHELEFILPSQEQVLALHHDWYILPKKYGDGAVFNEDNDNEEGNEEGNEDNDNKEGNENDETVTGTSDGANEQADI